MLLGCEERLGEAAGVGATSATAGAGGAGGSATGQGGDLPAGTIRVMTWNLESYPLTADTEAEVLQVLADERPDLVAVQEIDDEPAFYALDEALPDYASTLASQGDGYIKVGLLYNPSRVEIFDVQTLFTADDYAFPRAMLSARVRELAIPDHDFRLGIVHLKAQLDQDSEDRRRAACVALDTWIGTEQAAGPEQEFVVVGDFNDELLDPPQWNVFGPLLTSADGGFVTLPLEQAGDATYIPFTSFIDHALVRGSALYPESSARVLYLDSFITSYRTRVSDHRPVMVSLTFSAP